MTTAAANPASAVYFSGRSYHSTSAALASTAAGSGTVAAFNKGGAPGFSDLLDILNPLQHIPVVNTIYRQLTGDTESAAADIIGGALYGGPIGAAAAVVDLGIHDATGKTAGDSLMAMFTDKDAKDTMTAAADPKTGATTTPAMAAATMAATPKILASSIPGANASAPASAGKPAITLQPASMTPTVLGQSANAVPMAAQAAAGPMVAQAAAGPTLLTPPSATQAAVKASAPAPRVAVAPIDSAGNGPATEGNYLVFGSTKGSSEPAASQSSQAAPEAAHPAAAPKPKEFAVYGGNAAPGKTLPPVDGEPAAPSIPVNVASATTRERVFPIPPRNGPAIPLAVLPPPTTGPGALPGGKSQALSAQDLSVAQDPQHNFLTAYTQALDKYRNAQKLSSSPFQPATSLITGKPDPVPVPAVATGDDSVSAPADVTVH